MKIVIVIPARYGSSRLEGKVLAKETGKYLVQHTYEQALKSGCAERVLVATDDERVVRACREFGAECVMTRADHPSGTDRIAEAVGGVDCEIVVNLQADEPEIEPAYLSRAAGLLEEHPEADMGTLLAPFETAEQVANPNIVKCVTDGQGRALYFSRCPIPYDRQRGGIGRVEDYKRHLGLYVYRKSFLLEFPKLPRGVLEPIEKLEQLRALENGYTIWTAMVEKAWDGIDTAGQYEAFVKRMRAGKKAHPEL
ncbi:MAG TPA: 3-deoxy-manno-octulosonate cytidylyltransferase [Anaerohalosphaeraceae bacterium]|nr:3-deoxy-manno-octulosonate cytidylyltransferase [Anaerohalosphaeraceae bacterium]HPB93931.1 3-deoxy-manno-octulosonate cytidylyltransferase [Anaerohalosphaeraceae bacterium]HRT24516.1 3-deoxy-manno-octulosonate cytidylyltransferase [Anaerohalosphaeraceae bacterium]HRU16045.1 3-deoxy-manno-octulosonate cytidylyltransferase [Anaerohalosphaeraceae bacterium]